jgi:hypothetical protein
VPNSVLEAIREGIWDFEPEPVKPDDYSSTEAMPGTSQKLCVLAERVRLGLPLWHPLDRHEWDDSPESN